MDDRHPRTAPNYTTACIVMFGVNLFWILFAIWAIWGLLAAALLGWSVNHAMTRLHQRAQARRAVVITRGK